MSELAARRSSDSLLPVDGEGQSLTLSVGEGPIARNTAQEVRNFGEKVGISPTLLADLLVAVEETERKILRHRGVSGQITVRATATDAVVKWTASAVRISTEDSRAIYIGPLPQSASQAGLPAVNRDSLTAGTGWQWLQRGVPQAILLSRPHPRETRSGDVALVGRHGNKLRLAVVDGLGHGPMAREAALRAVQSLRTDRQLDIEESVLHAHEQLAATRGATLGLVDIDLTTQIIRGTTVGNVRVALFLPMGRTWSPCGTDAVLGHGRGGSHGRLDVRVEQHPYPPNAMLALFSDGLLNQLRLPWQHGDLGETAVQLFHTFSVATDDATLLLLG